MRCPRCHTECPEESVFCVACGHALAHSAAGNAAVPLRQARPSSRRWLRLALAVLGCAALVLLAAGALWLVKLRAPRPSVRLALLQTQDNRVSLLLATAGQTETVQAFGGADDIHYLTLAGQERATPFLAGGRGLLFVATEGLTTSLYRLDTGAETPTVVITHSGDIRGTFSSDGQLLLLHTREQDGQSRAVLLDGQGKKAPQTVGVGDTVEFALSPRKDTLWIRTTRSGRSRLDLVDAKGNTLTVLADDAPQAWAAYSPDGKRLLLWTPGITQSLGSLSLVDTGHPQQRQALLAVNARCGGFVDGGRSVWLDRVDPQGQSLLLLELSSQRAVEVANGVTRLQVHSGQGRNVFFEVESGGYIDLYAVQAHGRRLRFCARGVLPGSVAITPDADSTAFLLADGNAWTLMLYDQQAAPLSNRAGSTAPDFSADGDWIAFEETSSGTSTLWTSRRDGSKRRMVAPGGDAAVWSR